MYDIVHGSDLKDITVTFQSQGGFFCAVHIDVALAPALQLYRYRRSLVATVECTIDATTVLAAFLVRQRNTGASRISTKTSRP